MLIKGQVFSLDFMIACSIFILAFTVIFVYWRYTTLQIDETRELNDMSFQLNYASQAWFDEGIPEYWSQSDIIKLGLSNKHIFNQTKMNSLSSIGHEKVLGLLGINYYNLSYRVSDEYNNTLFEFGYYPENAETILREKRVGILNNSIAIVEVLLWR